MLACSVTPLSHLKSSRPPYHTLYYSKSAPPPPRFYLSFHLSNSFPPPLIMIYLTEQRTQIEGERRGEKGTLAATKLQRHLYIFLSKGYGIIFATLNDVTRYLYSVEASATPTTTTTTPPPRPGPPYCNIEFSLCVVRNVSRNLPGILSTTAANPLPPLPWFATAIRFQCIRVSRQPSNGDEINKSATRISVEIARIPLRPKHPNNTPTRHI